MEFVHELVKFREGADSRVNVAVVVDVISAVGERRRVKRAHPHGVDSEAAEIGDFRDDSAEVADSVAVGVFE